MTKTTFTPADAAVFAARGISQEKVQEQLHRFEQGFPFLKLAGSANVGNGILKLDAAGEEAAIKRWNRYLADGGDVTKFVPASGAASRMFKALFAFINGSEEQPEPGSDVARLLDNLDKLPFIEELNDTLMRKEGLTAAGLHTAGRNKDIIKAIVENDGMNYGGLPKGLLSFHSNENGVRTPLEEQMAEGAQTAATNGNVNLHFTVSANHRDLFAKKISEVQPHMEKTYGVRYNISLSEQKPSTDTVAATADNEMFRDETGAPVFRPGGHGALIENLGDIDSTVIFVKNIDNVVPDSQRADTIRYKRIIGGVLIGAQDTVAQYLSELRSGNCTRARLDEMLRFLENVLCTVKEGAADLADADLAAYLEGKFNRPLRVCGMVVNEGEPGGGPYLAYNPDGSYSPQILESSQIDTNDSRSMTMMTSATHFNPVDLVCYVKDIDGNRFDLKRYVDPDTGFISSKSLSGRELKALELPGLWNGAMADWNTIFVEVPASTFNPVKTVNDLLRPIHQA